MDQFLPLSLSECKQAADRFCTDFFPWYNHAHHNSGVAYLMPYEVHYGMA